MVGISVARGRAWTRPAILVAALLPGTAGGAWADAISYFTAGDLVISVEGNGSNTGTYADNSAAPITLDELSLSGTSGGIAGSTTANAVGSIMLPQTQSGSNNPISGEYGSSSEGTLELSGDGHSLTIAGYDVAASTFNANPQGFGGATKTCISPGPTAVTCYPLAQTASVPGTPGSAGSGVTTATVVARDIALIGPNGGVNTSTALTGIFNENNPRSVATQNGTSFYISGQGEKNDTTTQGLFYAPLGATTATQIYGTVDTRTVEIQNNQLYLSTDSTEGSGVTENISSVGSAGSLPTSATTPTVLPNLASKFKVTSLSQLNTMDQATLSTNPAFTTASKTKGDVYLSPEQYFFASPTVLYVADSGNPKGDNNGSSSSGTQGLSDGGLQKWVYNGTEWILQYTLSTGLDLVPDTTACGSNQVGCGTTGLIGLTGEDVDIGGVEEVDLFATNATLGDEDQTYLYGITDVLGDMTNPGDESFTVLDMAAPDTIIRGVAFAPVPEPSSLAILWAGLLGLGAMRRRRG